MNQLLPQTDLTASTAFEVEKQELITALKKLKHSAIFYVFTIAFIVFIQELPLFDPYQMVWVAWMLAVRAVAQIIYLYSLNKINNQVEADNNAVKWLLRGSALLTSVGWSITPFIFNTPNIAHSEKHFYLIVCLIVVCMTYLLMSMPRLDLLWAFVVPIFAGLAFRMYEINSENMHIVILGLSAIMAVLHFFAQKMKNLYTSQIILSKENKELADSLEHSQIQLKKTIEILHDKSLRDELTNLPNRRFLMSEFLRMKTSDDNSQNFGLLIVDLDHFKKINDNYGHLVGDIVLRETARLLEENLLGKDLVARFGGEEFVILLPETSLRNTISAAEKLRKKLEETKIYYQGKDFVTVTASIGLTVGKINEDFEEVFERADIAVYEAKDSGRNCVKTNFSADNYLVNQLQSLEEQYLH